MKDYSSQNVRVRIAPSPTGPLHIGTARTALFNYLLAKKYKGHFILRIEDTDLERSDVKWEKDIIESLIWLGIMWDEGPDPANPKNYIGEYSPYRQSERLETYATYLEKLLKEDKAYYCFCTEKELETMRKEQMSRGEAPRYNGKCSNLSKKEVKRRLGLGEKSIIRFRVPHRKVVFDDLIRGKIEFDTSLIGDIVIAKDLATPLYNFAVVVDDFEMKITYVLRGEDHISNTPKQILIQEALGFPRPQYAHLPLILGSDRSKLSKRHGAISVREYRQQGYLPEALINFMALLGWNPGIDKEIYSIEELIEDFSLERIQKSGAIFNIQKLDYLNGVHIRRKSVLKLTELCLPYLVEAGLIEPIFKEKQYPPAYGGLELVNAFKISETGETIDWSYLEKIVGLYQERLKKLSEIVDLVYFFFKDKLQYDRELLRWKDMSDKEVTVSLDKLEELLSNLDKRNFTKENLEKILMPEAEKIGDKGKLLWPFRVALTGKKASAGPFEIAEVLGKERVLKRIKEAKGLLENK